MAQNTPESVAKAILALYEEQFDTYLTEVEEEWVATDPIELYDFEDRRITIMPENLTVYFAQPALGIGVGNMREELEEVAQIQRSERVYVMDLRIVYYLKSNDDQELAKIVLRYVEATLRFLQDNPRFGLGRLFTVENIRIEPSANVFDTGGNMLVKGVRFSFDIKMIQRG